MQLESLDRETRNRLWSLLKVYIWDRWNRDINYNHDAKSLDNLLIRLWFRYFKEPIDTKPPLHFVGPANGKKSLYDILRDYFFRCLWNEVFDLVEFIIGDWPYEESTTQLVAEMNGVLREESSAYRIVGRQFNEITNESEIAEVDAAAETALGGVSTHIATAVKFLSDRKTPDYRNSVKESISAVESLFKVLTKNQAATLADGLKEVKRTAVIHASLIEGFNKIYGYTSDQAGIRHAIFDTDKTTHADAKFMLVSCSAFINYVLGKWAESGKNID